MGIVTLEFRYRLKCVLWHATCNDTSTNVLLIYNQCLFKYYMLNFSYILVWIFFSEENIIADRYITLSIHIWGIILVDSHTRDVNLHGLVFSSQRIHTRRLVSIENRREKKIMYF